jgi:hypothetical protein
MKRTAKTPRRQGLPLHRLGVFASSWLLLVVLLATLVYGAEGDSEVEVPEARSALATLDTKLKAQAWTDALGLARDLVEKHGGDLVATSDRSFAPASIVVREKLGALPEEGRATFARLFEVEARKALEEAKTASGPSSLAAFGDRYFPLDQGAEALLLAGDRFLERGNVPFAVDSWSAVALHHPSKERRAQALRRIEGALPILGSRSLVHKIAGELDSDAGTAFDAKAKEVPRPALEDFAVDSSGAVGPIASFVRPWRPRHVFSVHDSVPAILDWRNVSQRVQRLPMLASAHLGLEGLLVLHLGRALVAVDPATAKTVWRHNDRLLGRYFQQLARARLASRWGIAHDGARLYATLETDALEADMPRGKLVALDARTGKLLWDALADEWTEKPREQEREARLSFVGTPLPCGGRVFCGATDATQPGETWIAACDAESGHVLWKRKLAVSTPVVLPGGRGARLRIRAGPADDTVQRLPAPYLGLVKGALVVCSNNGAIAALDPIDGRFLWARVYPSKTDTSDAADYARGANPIVEVGGVAVVLPADGEKLLVVRVADGEFVHEEARSGLRWILGASGGRLYLSGEARVVAFELVGEKLVASWLLSLEDSDHELGRGLLGRTTLLVPGRSGILEFDLVSGSSATQLIPWGDDAVAGDLVGCGSKVASVGVLRATLRE